MRDFTVADEGAALEIDPDEARLAEGEGSEAESRGSEELEPGAEDSSIRASPAADAHVRAPKIKVSLSKIKTVDKCRVCGGTGHAAGFVGSVYVDCPMKPCYLCKELGHSTASCPHRFNPEEACQADIALDTRNIHTRIAQREIAAAGTRQPLPPKIPRWQLDAAIVKLHTRRVTTLAFHPQNERLVISGDKKGHIGIWDMDAVHERTVHRDVHQANCNQMQFLPGGDGSALLSTSGDGTLCQVDVETGDSRQLLNLQPGGWIPGVSNEKNWGMMLGLAQSPDTGAVFTGDSHGRLHMVDHRAPGGLQASWQMHKKGTKLTSLDFNPCVPHLLLSGGNDHFARLFDVRQLSCTNAMGPINEDGTPPEPSNIKDDVGLLAEIAHPRVINAAYFSPVTGQKILTTCQDNRLRVWDSLVEAIAGKASREIVHSHDFNRYLSPFKAEWHPRDPMESMMVVGRYISDDYSGQALHPVDLIQATTGRTLASLVDANLTTICPVNKMHPQRDLIVSGSSGSLYVWKPATEDEEGGTGDSTVDGPSTSSAAPRSATYTMFDCDEKGKGKGKGKASPSSKTKKQAASATTPTKPAKKAKTAAKASTDAGPSAAAEEADDDAEVLSDGGDPPATPTPKAAKGKGKVVSPYFDKRKKK